MKQSVLFGTASQAKLDHVQALLWQLPVNVVSPADVGLAFEVQGIDDAPLSSLMQDPNSGAHYSEMDYAERPDSAQLGETLLALFKHLPS